MGQEQANVGDRVHAALGANERIPGDGLKHRGDLLVTARNKDGEVLWTERLKNLITDEGKDYGLDVALLAATQLTAWYLALIDTGGTLASGDTYASHAGWTENTNYDEAARPTWSGADTGVGTADNSASKATYTISTGGATIAGVAFVSDSTKGDTVAAGAKLYSESLFAAERALSAGDTLTVQYDQSLS